MADETRDPVVETAKELAALKETHATTQKALEAATTQATTFKEALDAERAKALVTAANHEKQLAIAAKTGAKTGVQTPPATSSNPVLDLINKKYGLKSVNA